MSGKYYPAERWLEMKDRVIDEIVDRVDTLSNGTLSEDIRAALIEALGSMTYDVEDFNEERGDFYDDCKYL